MNKATKIYIAVTAGSFGERRRLAGAIRDYLAAGTATGNVGRRYIGPRSMRLRERLPRAARLAGYSLLREQRVYLMIIAAAMIAFA